MNPSPELPPSIPSEPERQAPPPPPAGPLKWVSGALVVLAALGVIALFVGRRSAEAHEALRRQSELARGPRVEVVPVTATTGDRSITVTGEARAFAQSMLYAKVSGYLKDLKVDRGDRVKAGQLLAVLESPDSAQQVAAARADVEVKRELAQRDAKLLKSRIVSEQEAQQAQGAFDVAKAQLARAEVLQGYAQLRAPFDGVVTGRFADPGALLPAATGATASAQPVLEISDTDRLRVAVYLGQEDAAQVEAGDAAQLRLPTGEAITARVSRMSRSLDPRTRTMLAEIDLDNRTHAILPGTFLQVRLTVKARAYPVVPAGALISRHEALYVARVDGKTAHLVPVKVGSADGKTVQILSGAAPGEKVAINAGEVLTDGMTVDPVDAAAGAR